MYMYKQGQLEYSNANMDLSNEELDAIMRKTEGDQGTLKHLDPVLEMSETKPFWDKPSPVLGSSKPEWLS